MRQALSAAAALLALLAPAGAAASRGPCVPGKSSPRCSFRTAKVSLVADGDTIRARIRGTHASKRIRLTGINAMELHLYSKRASRRRGDCHGVEATNFIERYIKRAHWKVRLGDQRDDSRSGQRLRRSVWVRLHGRWIDLARKELQAGLALWLPNKVEWAHNAEYRELAAKAAAAQRGLYDPDSCGAGPNDDLPLRVWVNWDADSTDKDNLNDEWIQIQNDGDQRLPLSGWWVRDSYLYRSRTPAGRTVTGYAFPASAAIPPGGAIRVHVGCGTNTATDLHWCQRSAVFENVTTDAVSLGDGGYLFDPQGDLRASSIFPCAISCSDPAQGRAKVDAHPNNPESVSVTNTGAGPLDLYGYLLKLHHPESRDVFIASYQFDQGTVLGPGETVRVDLTGSPSSDTRLERHWGLHANVLRDREGAASLRTFTDIVIDCHSWGSGHC